MRVESDHHAGHPPSGFGFQPDRSVGAQGGRSAATVDAVRPRAPDGLLLGAPALRRVLRPQTVASRSVFPRVCWAFDSVGHRLSRIIEQLREDAPAPANYGVCWERNRACGGVCCGDLRVGRVMTSACYYSRIEGRWGWVAEMRGRVAGWAHPLEKLAPGFEDTSIHRLCY